MRGRILKGIGGFYYALDEEGRIQTLRAQGKFRREHKKPMVGDEIELTCGAGDEEGWIVSILPRRNQLVRPPVANIDTIVVIAAAAAPDPDLLMLDRLILNARIAGIEPRLVVTKCDLAPDVAEDIVAQYRGADVEPMFVSARTGENLDALRAALRGRVHALAGQSGAGKSSLINALYGLELETGDISRKIERGKNTTRHCELICVEGGGMVLDTPGFSLLETPVMEPERLREYYPEFAEYEGMCYFKPCMHAREPKCAALEAMAKGRISPERHGRYVELLDDMRVRWRDRYG